MQQEGGKKPRQRNGGYRRQHEGGATTPLPTRISCKRNREQEERDELPEDLVGTLIYLCSSDSDFMTGQVLAVDGGANNT